MRIAFFIDNLIEGLDGSTLTSHQIASKLPEEYTPIFFTAMPSRDKGFKHLTHIVKAIKIPFSGGYKFALPRKKRIFEILDAFKPDLIHWSSPSLLGKCAISYAKRRNIPNVSIYHAHFPVYVKYIKWLLFKKAALSFTNTYLSKMYGESDKVFAPSGEMKVFLKSIGISADRIIIWGRGVDCILFNPNKAEGDFFLKRGIPNGKFILFVSRLVQHKETDTLIRLSHKLKASNHLIIVGDGPELKKMKRECSLNTFFLGRIEGSELAKIYASSDVFVFPSISETYGNVINEAMASGLPIVAANGGGPSNIISNGENGFLVEPKNEMSIIRRIDYLVNNPNEARRIKENARTFVEGKSWTIMVKKLFDEYKKVLLEY